MGDPEQVSSTISIGGENRAAVAALTKVFSALEYATTPFPVSPSISLVSTPPAMFRFEHLWRFWEPKVEGALIWCPQGGVADAHIQGCLRCYRWFVCGADCKCPFVVLGMTDVPRMNANHAQAGGILVGLPSLTELLAHIEKPPTDVSQPSLDEYRSATQSLLHHIKNGFLLSGDSYRNNHTERRKVFEQLKADMTTMGWEKGRDACDETLCDTGEKYPSRLFDLWHEVYAEAITPKADGVANSAKGNADHL